MVEFAIYSLICFRSLLCWVGYKGCGRCCWFLWMVEGYRLEERDVWLVDSGGYRGIFELYMEDMYWDLFIPQ